MSAKVNGGRGTKMKRILFQGDSITDVKRMRENDNFRGMGYPTLVSARLGFEHPEQYEFINRGVSGDRVVDLLARMRRDILNIKPDVMSILIGVNDVWHEFPGKDGVPADLYEAVYDMLIREVKAVLPKIKIMILEPFVLKGSGTQENWDVFRSEVEERSKKAKKIAEKYDLTFVPLMKKFDDLQNIAPAAYWLMDGVHPTAAGHELIAREWVKAFAGCFNQVSVG